jgi:hypothetical protein
VKNHQPTATKSSRSYFVVSFQIRAIAQVKKGSHEQAFRSLFHFRRRGTCYGRWLLQLSFSGWHTYP